MKATNNKLETAGIAVVSIGALLCLVTTLVAQTQKGDSSDRNKLEQIFHIAARTLSDRYVFELGEPIVLRLSVTNSSDADLFILQSCESLDYKLTVKNEQGQNVPLTTEGQRLTNRYEVICRHRKLKIEPAKSREAIIDLSTLYDMSAKGTYYITVSRWARNSNNDWVTTESNTIEVVVR